MRYPISVADIVSVVSQESGVNVQDLLSQKRSRTYTRPRQLAMYMARKHTSSSYPQIGRDIGRRDHTTVIHGERSAKEVILSDPEYADLATRVNERIELMLATCQSATFYRHGVFTFKTGRK